MSVSETRNFIQKYGLCDRVKYVELFREKSFTHIDGVWTIRVDFVDENGYKKRDEHKCNSQAELELFLDKFRASTNRKGNRNKKDISEEQRDFLKTYLEMAEAFLRRDDEHNFIRTHWTEVDTLLCRGYYEDKHLDLLNNKVPKSYRKIKKYLKERNII